MISAHLSGQIFANMETGFYCFMGKEARFPKMPEKKLYSIIVNPFVPKKSIQTWADNPQFCDPSLVKNKKASPWHWSKYCIEGQGSP